MHSGRSEGNAESTASSMDPPPDEKLLNCLEKEHDEASLFVKYKGHVINSRLSKTPRQSLPHHRNLHHHSETPTHDRLTAPSPDVAERCLAKITQLQDPDPTTPSTLAKIHRKTSVVDAELERVGEDLRNLDDFIAANTAAVRALAARLRRREPGAGEDERLLGRCGSFARFEAGSVRDRVGRLRRARAELRVGAGEWPGLDGGSSGGCSVARVSEGGASSLSSLLLRGEKGRRSRRMEYGTLPAGSTEGASEGAGGACGMMAWVGSYLGAMCVCGE